LMHHPPRLLRWGREKGEVIDMKTKFWKKKWFYCWIPFVYMVVCALIPRGLDGWGGLGYGIMVFPVLFIAFILIYPLFYSANLKEAGFAALFVLAGFALGGWIAQSPPFEVKMLLLWLQIGFIGGLLSFLIGGIKVGIKKLTSKKTKSREEKEKFAESLHDIWKNEALKAKVSQHFNNALSTWKEECPKETSGIQDSEYNEEGLVLNALRLNRVRPIEPGYNIEIEYYKLFSNHLKVIYIVKCWDDCTIYDDLLYTENTQS